MKETIAKSGWLDIQECPAMAWHELHCDHQTPTEADQFRMQQGQEIGVLARSLYPTGIDASDRGSNATAILMASGCDVIFEAKATALPFIAKADIIQRDGAGWHVIEVKSSFSDTSSLNELVDDLAYTVMVLTRSDIKVVRASLLLLARTYRFGDSPDQLFELLDKTPEVLARASEYDGSANGFAGMLFQNEPPTSMLSSACRDCDHFASKCLGAGIGHTVLEIPNLHHKKLARLAADRVVDLSAIPSDLGLNARQERSRQAAISGQLIVESELGNALGKIIWPCHYLDFETVATVLPLYSGHGCHQQVLTQFSVHHRESPISQMRHSEFLADAARECQRELAEALINAVGQDGSILVYSSFERTRIKALITDFQELADPLNGILDRLFDLHSCITNYVSHPDFKGSSSIKKVLPALVPDLSYQELAIRDGDTAITRFARLARGEISAHEIPLTRVELLHYCKLDTLAMLKLHEALCDLASA